MIASRKLRWTAASAYVLALTAASLLPSGPGVLGGWDSRISPRVQDAGHLPAYSLLLIVIVWAGSASHGFRTRHVVATALACCTFGLLMELAQAFVPGRTCSASDELANVIGVASGVVVLVLWRLVRRPNRRNLPPVGPSTPDPVTQIVQSRESK
jgi:VanZ family protein